MKTQTKSNSVQTLTLLFMSLAFAAAGHESKSNINGKISRNVDGDTVWVSPRSLPPDTNPAKPNTLKIRMLAIDAPESCYPTAGGCVGQGHFGTDSKNVLAKLIPVGTSVSVEDHGIDKFKRTLGRIFLGEDDINLNLVRSGNAVTFIICEGESCDSSFMDRERAEEYMHACEEARENGAGFWNPKDTLTEMPYEFRIRISGRKPERFVGDIETKELFSPADYREVDACKRIFFATESDAINAGFDYRKVRPNGP